MTDSIARLREAGVSVWLDDLSRERLTTGSLAALRDRGVSGVTTNPTIFAKAITDSDAYEGQLRDLELRQVATGQVLRELTAADVRQACDVLRPVHDATGGVDGRVSIEVDPRIAHDTQRTIAEARALWWLVDRPNMFVKIPAAKQGIPAIVRCVSWAIRGSTSIDTRPSTPPVASYTGRSTSHACRTSAAVSSRSIWSVAAWRNFRSWTWAS